MLIFVDLATSGTGGFGYFIATCAIVGAFGVAGGNVEGAVMGELSFMRPEFIQKYDNGLRKGASMPIFCTKRPISEQFIFISLYIYIELFILSNQLLIVPNSDNCLHFAVLFLATSTFIELLCILLYAIYFPRLPIVEYYRSKAASEGFTSLQLYPLISPLLAFRNMHQI
ncbi:putative equilibrative nucleoside transporter [Rosa chinensis]|uniref:Putative equilibrative nucleoside transporter n=1 Tax=Rosa chinensis TaxID=74649 RepID=A0A2P6Q3E8_ROSCH|nr:putative equilibrative nucleoside transporter [Rosa chinensis]